MYFSLLFCSPYLLIMLFQCNSASCSVSKYFLLLLCSRLPKYFSPIALLQCIFPYCSVSMYFSWQLCVSRFHVCLCGVFWDFLYTVSGCLSVVACHSTCLLFLGVSICFFSATQCLSVCVCSYLLCVSLLHANVFLFSTLALLVFTVHYVSVLSVCLPACLREQLISWCASVLLVRSDIPAPGRGIGAAAWKDEEEEAKGISGFHSDVYATW